VSVEKDTKSQVKNVLPLSATLRKLTTCPRDSCRCSREEVFRVLNIDLGDLPKAELPVNQWLSALDASGLPMRLQAVPTQGIAMSGASSLRQRPVTVQLAGQLGGIGTEPIATGRAVGRPWMECASFPIPAYGYVSAALRRGRAATNHNSTVKQYATSINAVGGVGTSGPPRRQKPA
jgi:hypothetical protein